MAKLEKFLIEKTKNDPKIVWPILFKRFIDDGFGITKGSKSDVEYWIAEFNKLVKSIEIDKYKYGPKVEFMDIVIFKGGRFFKNGFFDIKLFQKEQNKYAYIPQKSNHRKHTIKNYVLNELKRYVKFNSNKLTFLRLRNKFFDRLRNRGFAKYKLGKLFSVISYSSRKTLLYKNDPVQISNVVQETEAETRLVHMAEMIFSQEIEVEAEAEDHTDRATESKLISSKVKVGFSICSKKKEKEKSKSDFSLCMALPGECNEFKDKIASIFNEEFCKFCHRSKRFKDCFEKLKIEAIYRNEAKIGNYVSKTKI